MLDQSERRVLKGQPVPAGDKLVGLFEPHADIIVKGARDVQYGPAEVSIIGRLQSGQTHWVTVRPLSALRWRGRGCVPASWKPVSATTSAIENALPVSR